MNVFSISELARFSGIKPHNIRVWESRYNALTPERSEGNTRYYDNNQLRRLLNIVSLTELNYKASELCAMPDEQLFSLVKKLQAAPENEAEGYFISQLIAAGVNYDEIHFDKIFSNCLLRFGMRDTYQKIIYPLLVRVGLLWADNTMPPAQEHFINNLFRQKIFAAIDSLPPAKNDAEQWILFLPENEFHEMGLLFANYLIRLYGKKVIYLGPNIPFEALHGAVKTTEATNLLLFMVHNDTNEAVNGYINELAKGFPRQKIHIAAGKYFIDDHKSSRHIRWLGAVEELEALLVK